MRSRKPSRYAQLFINFLKERKAYTSFAKKIEQSYLESPLEFIESKCEDYFDYLTIISGSINYGEECEFWGRLDAEWTALVAEQKDIYINLYIEQNETI